MTQGPSTALTSATGRLVGTSALVAVAVIASMHALETVIVAGDWTGTGTRLVLVLAAVTCLARIVLERDREQVTPPAALAPSLVGAAVAVWGLLGLYGGPTDRFSIAVGLTNVERLTSRLTTARELTASETAPIDPSLPIELLAVGGVVVVFLVADLVAGGLRIPAATGLPLLALWVPGLVLVGTVPTTAFVVTVLSLLLMLAVDNPYRAVRRSAVSTSPRTRRAALGLRTGGSLAVAAAVTVGALVLGSSSAAVPQVVSSSWSRIFASEGQTVRLSDDLDMQRNLGERSGQRVLTYETAGQNLGPLRMFTLTGFDGTNWRRGQDRDGVPVADADEMLWPNPDVEREGGREARITLESLRDTLLPLPTEPRTLEAEGDWSYDATRDEVRGPDRTSSGTTFTVTAYARPLTPESLRTASGPDPDDPNYLEVPSTSRSEDIGAVAAEVTAGAGSRYDQALALQTYFRDTTRFTYSTEVPPGETGDSVWDFLQDRTGYCVQYATSMTVMARSLGIPARVGVGFLPGQRTSDTTFQVTGRDSHAWPELYFPGEGWVRFEPTPAQQSGPVPRWADPVVAGDGEQQGQMPDEVPTAGAAEEPAPEEEPAATAPTTQVGGQAGSGLPGWAWLGAAGAVLALVLGGAAWLLRRRGPTEAGVRDAESAWEDLAARLGEVGVSWPVSVTPRRAPQEIVGQVRVRTGRPVPEEAVEALATLAQALENQRYARRSTPTDAAGLDELVETAVAVVDDELSGRPARVADPSALPAGR
ncbi:DUF3488 and transglutaminase-like domain-containing protein [Oerskovia flava]|uniref:transglutaminase family protein n=1 Tax=Oerskovia flava TaxID=2986422 RepID=UPI0022409D3F|nr:DUF3488 and transglutaminase-like domain-containing protein [Oerskovia sp. JB1-3-2]